MSVTVQNLQSGGRVAGSSIFRDTFNRANGGIGTNYIVVPNSGTITAINTMEGLWGVVGNQGQLNNTTGGVQILQSFLFPYVNPNNLFGRTQYSQVRIISGAVASSFGLEVMGVPIGDLGYYLRIFIGAPNKLILYGRNQAVDNNLLQDPFDGGLAWVSGDMIKISVVPTATENTISSWINGVRKATFVDNIAGRPVQVGMPGMAAGQLAIAATFVFDDFECGSGEGQ